ncbi:MAG: RNA-binding S4 domain-containing protein [Ruminococcaceae bacterium]|nr:RNA-binding S4 domain-containing protein [Oscillospiraceae bacterium]
MRLDKFLKVSRIIKRRTVANEYCDAGRVEANGKIVKASYDVKEGDTLTVRFGEQSMSVRVLTVTEYATKETASQMYEILK